MPLRAESPNAIKGTCARLPLSNLRLRMPFNKFNKINIFNTMLKVLKMLKMLKVLKLLWR